MRKLMHKYTAWSWSNKEKNELNKLKKTICKYTTIRFYNVNNPVVIQCVASKDGLGAALLQNNVPVAYASKSLTNTEQIYAQIEKEILAIIFACKKCNQYIYTYGKNNITI